MATLSAIRTKTRLQISEQDSTDSHFTDSELNGFINEGILFFATKVQYPRSLATVAPADSQGIYSLPTDNMFPVCVFFGNRSIENDTKELSIWNVERLTKMYPNWLETTSKTTGEPEYFILYSRSQFYSYPRPDAENSVAGKFFHIYYINYPTTLSDDSSSPDLPLAYHDHIATYAAHMCYGTKLKNPEMAKSKFDEVVAKLKQIELPSIQETKELGFYFKDDIYI